MVQHVVSLLLMLVQVRALEDKLFTAEIANIPENISFLYWKM